MKIASSKGHTLRGADYGASGIREESLLIREVGYKVDEKLRVLGHEVVDCHIDEASSVGESLSYRVNIANNSCADFFFEIHFNCGGGHGVEIFTYGGKEIPEARNILNNIVALGYTNRGIKDGSSLYVVRNTNMTGILIECCFIDNVEDMNRYNAEDLANAIVKGLVGQTINEGDFDMEMIILYYGDADSRIALTYGEKYDCPVLSLNSYKKKGYKSKKIYIIGGNETVEGDCTLISGADRESTLKKVVNTL